ncbi:MAG: carbon starvation protein A [Halanaerobiales bacterium]|nr:carbon starvation protein A [Halanaerobiales bacterium]
MNALLVAVVVMVIFYVAYRFYGTYISIKIFELNPNRVTPAHEFQDNVDFVPTNKNVLFGHHFTSIAGAAPIVGPAIAVIWGWVPALLWIVFGTIFLGAVHDFGSLVVSLRYKGRSVGDITEKLIGPRAKFLFMLIIFFALTIVIAVFALVIASLFMANPSTVFPIFLEIPLAIALGFLVYKKGKKTTIPAIIAVIILYFSIWAGLHLPFHMPALFGSELMTWIVVLLVYCYIASILPVWTLLQPRDYLNSHQLFVGLGLMALGLVVARPQIVAPAFNASPSGAPSMLPFLFITIACGAISGFHSLVSSGTTVKQLNVETDAKRIGYGGMIAEGVLALFAVLACTAGFASKADWAIHYASWDAAQGLAAKVGAFVNGGASFLNAYGIPAELAQAIIAVIVISFAATTLDSATRIQRYVISEISETIKLKPLTNRYSATLVAVVTAFLLSMINGGKGGLILWPLFGVVNQLLAALALLVITVYLYRRAKSVKYTLLPMIFMMIMTGWAMVINLQNYINQGDILLTVLGAIIFILEIWMIFEAWFVWRKNKIGNIGFKR